MSKINIPIPAVDFQPPVYVCRRAAGEFTLDGRLDKPFWENAPWTDAFLDIEGSHMPLPRFLTRAKMLWDDENIYFGAQLDGDEIWDTSPSATPLSSTTTTLKYSSTLTQIPSSIMSLK